MLPVTWILPSSSACAPPSPVTRATRSSTTCSAPNTRTALNINPKLHFARLQLGLLYLTMSQPDDSLAIWAPLEELEETAALKAFKRGLEALIRDDFSACIGH